MPKINQLSSEFPSFPNHLRHIYLKMLKNLKNQPLTSSRVSHEYEKLMGENPSSGQSEGCEKCGLGVMRARGEENI